MLVICVFLTVVSASLGYVTLPTAPISLGSPWPMPQVYQPSNQTLVVSTALTFDTSSTPATKNCNVLQLAAIRCSQQITHGALRQRAPSYIPRNGFMATGRHLLNVQSNPDVTSVIVHLDTTCDETSQKVYPSQEMKEDYTMKINKPTIKIVATEVWGAIRALNTLSQLVYHTIDGTLTTNITTIKDFPRFSYRGAMVDTSRHFISKETILQNLDAMGMNKLNVFHWHIVDDNSFPYQSKVFPDLSAKGAFHPITHVYTQNDILDIVEYARRLGIRVVPEFDTPGHTLSWGAGQSDLLTKCYKGSSPDGTVGPIDPTKNSTYDFLSKLFGEITSLFPAEYLHLGGDEVSFGCWLSNPAVLDFMKKKGFPGDGAKLESYYEGQLVQLLAKVKPSGKNQKLVVWQEVADNKVQIPSTTIVHVWKGGNKWQSEMAEITKLGFPTILSSPWYLNYIAYGIDWQPFYAADPQNFPGTATQKEAVVGGEACLWSEFVDNTNLISRFWPRASVVAERLWSAANMTSADAAAPRLEAMRCRMVKQGFNAEPINNRGGFCNDEYSVKWKPIWEN